MTVGFRARRPLDRGQRPRADLGVQPHHIVTRRQFVAAQPKRLADHALQGVSRHRMRREAFADNQAQTRLLWPMRWHLLRCSLRLCGIDYLNGTPGT